MFKLRTKMSSLLSVGLAAFILFAQIADARSLGGGKSFGRQSNNFSQRQANPSQGTPPQSAPAQPAAQPQRAAPASTPAQQPAAQPPRNRWLGPLAGLATGLGIAALFSHFGMGAALAESMGSMLIIAALIMAGLFLWRRMRGNSQPLPANAAQARAAFDSAAWQTVPTSSQASSQAADATFAAEPATTTPVFTPNWSIPADFDVDKFLRSAKVFFVRLQAGWDKADLEDIREFTTSEMFAEIKLQINERGATANVTDVISINAELLGIEHVPRDQLASVRFTGTLRPAPDAATEAFDEVWNLTKSPTNPAGWILAGIQQAQ